MMNNDLEALDYYLLEEDHSIIDLLEKLDLMEIKDELDGYINKEYIKSSLKWLKNSYLPGIREKKLTYLSKEAINKFIDVAVKEVSKEIQSYINIKGGKENV